jgi:4,5-DOPA dioxygenase extradiol
MNLRAPVLFVSHCAPTVALEDDAYTQAVASFGAATRPRAVAVVSAHWEAPGPVRVNDAERSELIYDFSGFPRSLYAIEYRAPGAPDVAERALGLMTAAGIDAVAESSRGWDHGLWVPLRILYPDAAVPIVQISLPVPRTPESMFRIGEALAPLRDEGVMLVGSGGVVHNLRRLRWDDEGGAPEGWARDFDAWVTERLERRAFGEILTYRAAAPHADLAVPTSEHFDPIFFALGAASPADRVATVYAGFTFGTLSMRTFALAS